MSGMSATVFPPDEPLLLPLSLPPLLPLLLPLEPPLLLPLPEPLPSPPVPPSSPLDELLLKQPPEGSIQRPRPTSEKATRMSFMPQ
jgi:hypothetical protein